jgi:hypothetical protein
MTTPQQFLQSFWQAKVDAYADANVRLEAVHAQYFGEPLLKHAHDFMMRDQVRTVVEEVQQSRATVIVVAREPISADARMRNRYHLSADGESWKITRIDRECLYCRGTGRVERTASCQMCDGDGWYDPRKNAV